MKIVDNNNKQCCFNEIKEGEVFAVKGCYFLKIEKTPSSSFSVGYINAVNLETGVPICFDLNDSVINRNAKVVIE